MPKTVLRRMPERRRERQVKRKRSIIGRVRNSLYRFFAEKGAPGLVDFVEDSLERRRTGEFKGNLVFIGRTSRPLFSAARLLAEKHGVDRKNLKLVDLPRKFLEEYSPETIFKYLADNGAIEGNMPITIIDHGGRGGFIGALENTIRQQSGNSIKVNHYIIGSTSRGLNTFAGQNPKNIPKSVLAIASTTQAAHGFFITGLQEKKGKLVAMHSMQNKSERMLAREWRSAVMKEARKRLKV